MPNKRSPDQKMLIFPAKAVFIKHLDASLPACGYSNRSEFIRDAIREKLSRHGIRTDREMSTGAGRYPTHKPEGVELNEASSETMAAGAGLAAKAGEIVDGKAGAPIGGAGQRQRGASRKSRKK